ncbi:DUF418 domain-containing protein [Bacillus massilinigeriensis]|uniref:DUF418 domain-containing protein n=1 Tax=Bacillus mediterraneensis TaxID=1805474 RepID=UPI0009F4FF32|nr:DUF418 domain-containing protein [Bacillus mediterraneensis]
MQSGRIAVIDRMRGIALFGILLVNMMSFHSPILYMDAVKHWDTGLDSIIFFFIDVFVQGSFYPLFALVFGYSLSLMMERVAGRGLLFYKIALRRFTVLLMIGALHIVLVWHGDILVTYAICGFMLLIWMKLSGKVLVWLGSLFYAIPNILLFFTLLFLWRMMPSEMALPQNVESIRQSMEIYANGSFAEITSLRMKDWGFANLGSFLQFFISILPFFMMGVGAAKCKLFENVDCYKGKVAAFSIVMFLIGTAFKLLPFLLESNIFTVYSQDMLGGPLQAFSFAGFIALTGKKKYSDIFSAAGKISLTIYLSQSIILSFLFYGYGFGLYGKVTLTEGTMIAICLYVLQLLFSRWWVKQYYYGPVEWLLRAGSYWSLPKWKRERNL